MELHGARRLNSEDSDYEGSIPSLPMVLQASHLLFTLNQVCQIHFLASFYLGLYGAVHVKYHKSKCRKNSHDSL